MTLQRICVFIVFIFTVLFGFQNCSEPPVDLSRIVSSNREHSTVDIRGSLCLDPGFHLKSFFVINLSMKPDGDSLLSDVDRDGLSDIFEGQYGFDHNNPRSSGPVLDGICFYLTQTNDCHDLEIQCDEEKINELGFSECDVNALNLGFNNTPQLGIDSDDDGIPDKLEVLFELDPATDDALLDYDEDGITNKAEVLQSTHPRQQISTVPQEERLITRKVAPQDTSCAGEEWAFISDRKRIYKLGAHAGSSGNNHIWIMALSEKPQSSLTVDRKTQYIVLERNYGQSHETLVYSSNHFITADNDFFRQVNQ